MHLAGDGIEKTLDNGFLFLRHFHVSEPNLSPPRSSGEINHDAFAREVTRRGYDSWVSLEMREPTDFSIDAITAALRWLIDRYGDVGLSERRIAG
jgi:sugar phosphate isomerase/epimerase